MNVGLWHNASFAATHHFGHSWSNSRHRSIFAADGSVANDPERSSVQWARSLIGRAAFIPRIPKYAWRRLRGR
jgi:hypothetical protein